MDEYFHCSNTLIVQENLEWRPIGKVVQNFISKFLYPPQTPKTIEKNSIGCEKWIRGDIPCAHIKQIYLEIIKVQIQENLINTTKICSVSDKDEQGMTFNRVTKNGPQRAA